MQYSDVEIAFQDLVRINEELQNERQNPGQFRRHFADFIMQAQKLTEMMRSEYKVLTRESWKASNFDGWNAVSEAFKEFRNLDYHQSNILIQVRERQYIAVNDIFQDARSPGATLMFEGTWELGDPFADTPPNGLKLCRSDPKTGKILENEVIPTKRDFWFLIHPRTEECKKLLKSAEELVGTNDAHELSQRFFWILQAYFKHYQQTIKGTES